MKRDVMLSGISFIMLIAVTSCSTFVNSPSADTQELNPLMYQGLYQGEDWRVGYSRPDLVIVSEGAQLGTAKNTTAEQFTLMGTDIVIRWRGYHVMNVTLIGADGYIILDELQVEDNQFQGEGWHFINVPLSTTPETFRICISTAPRFVDTFGTLGQLGCATTRSNDKSETHLFFQLDYIIVLDRTFENIYPIASGAGVLGVFFVWVIVSAVQERRRR